MGFMESQENAQSDIRKALAESEEHFRRAVVNAPIPIMIHAEDGEVILISAAWTELTGYALDEIPTVATWSEKAHGEVTALIKAEIDLLYDLNERVQEGEYFIRTKDGETRVWDFSSAPLGRLPDGRRLVISAAMDVTRRKHAEERFRRVVESSPAGMLLVNPDGKIALTNLAVEKLFGYAREELVGQPLDVLVPERFRAAHAALCARFFEESRSKAIGEGRHLYGRRKDGAEIPLDIGLELIEGENGDLALCTVVDMTERIKYENALAEQAKMLAQAIGDLERSNEDLQQFAYVVSHDLQEPLRNISGLSHLLKRRYGGRMDEKADEIIRQILDGVERMSALISDLLAYSRLGTREPYFERTGCDQVLSEAMKNLNTAIQEKGAQITSGPLPEIRADFVQMTQLFQNLISNAIKFCQRQPNVHVSAQRTEDAAAALTAPGIDPASPNGWLFAVSDNGIGIESKYLGKIFAIFQRLHAGEEYPGTGVGLAICKRIVERHGGQIWARSQLGEGSTFYFTIPDESAGQGTSGGCPRS
jgi:PAS domain S-box-containing protein